MNYTVHWNKFDSQFSNSLEISFHIFSQKHLVSQFTAEILIQSLLILAKVNVALMYISIWKYS